MTKPKSKLKAAARPTSRSTGKSKSRTRLAPSFSKTAMRADTKHARIIAMLRAPAGTTIAAIMTATKWQQHSVRGFLAGVVRKRLGLNLVSEQTANGRVHFAPVMLREVRIEQLSIENVPAAVIENLDQSLLGMSFLKRLKRFEMREGALTISW